MHQKMDQESSLAKACGPKKRWAAKQIYGRYQKVCDGAPVLKLYWTKWEGAATMEGKK